MLNFMTNVTILIAVFCFFQPNEKMQKKADPTARVTTESMPQFKLENNASCSADYTACLTPDEIAINTASEAEAFMLETFVNSITVAQEQQIGKDFHEQMKYSYVTDARWKRLNKILNKMRPYFLRQEINYKIYLIEDPVINAWTVPGGNIYFTTGILNFAKSDDELANIIGHEVGHNECKHTHRHLKRSAGTNQAGNMLESIFGLKVDPQLTNLVVEISSIPLVSFGQVDELQADRTGFYLANKVGYDPMKGLAFWKRLAKQEKENFFEKFMRSHPYSSTRYNCGKSYLNSKRR